MNNRINLLLMSSIFATNICMADDSPALNVGASGMVVGYNYYDTPYKINAGYSFNENFSIEGNYVDFGKSDRFIGGGDASATGYSVELLAKYPIGDLTLYAKLGNLWWSEKGAILAHPFFGIDYQRIDESGTDIIYGIGVSYVIFSHFSIKIEYEESKVNNQTANPLSVGFDFSF